VETQQESQVEREREQVEQVFGLTGGELADRPWEPFAADSDGESFTRASFRYWYDGAPAWSEDGRHQAPACRTVVSDCLFGEEPEVLQEKGARWERIASYLSSGEAACPWRQDGDPAQGPDPRPCELCGAGQGEEHGHVYLGEGWCETVYRQVETCPDCGADLTYHPDYGDRCLVCQPYAFQVAAYGAEETVLYQGPDPSAAEAAYSAGIGDPKRAHEDIYLDLNGETIRRTARS